MLATFPGLKLIWSTLFRSPPGPALEHPAYPASMESTGEDLISSFHDGYAVRAFLESKSSYAFSPTHTLGSR